MKEPVISASRQHLLSDLWDLQQHHRYISDEAIAVLADRYGLSKVELEGVVSFYHFFHRQPAGRYTIYLNDSIVSELNGYAAVRQALEEATGAAWGSVDPSGQFGLFTTSCIGLSDLEPSALINFQPFTKLTPQKAKAVIWQLRRGASLDKLADEVPDNIRDTPPNDRAVLLAPFEMGRSLERLSTMKPEAVLDAMDHAGLRGMGGAFFPVGRKWRLCQEQAATPKYIICNADEGEPGTFKDRLLLKSYPGSVIEGMIIAGYATGAEHGIVYLRAEYHWLLPQLEAALDRYRKAGWLGADIPAKQPFAFDMRIQLGAGAYVCGEETALIHSLEGKRGEPSVRVYFPVEKGFFGLPTVVNNVETYAAAARILDRGADFYRQLGTDKIRGTRLLSVAGDCGRPGIYEIEWGYTLEELLNACEAPDARAVQISGPSGIMVRADDGHRRFDLDDLRCGGAVTIFNGERNLLQVLRNFSAFFQHESCGVCTPCRAGNFVFSRKLDKLIKGLGAPSDYEEIYDWSRIMKQASRCGLGQSATRALTSAMNNFTDEFACHFGLEENSDKRPFNLSAAVENYRQTVKS